jgi:hypothetical protein
MSKTLHLPVLLGSSLCFLGFICGCAKEQKPVQTYLLAIENAGKYIDCTHSSTTFRIHKDQKQGRELLVVNDAYGHWQLVSEIQPDGSLRIIGDFPKARSVIATKHIAKAVGFMLQENPNFPIRNFEASVELRGTVADVFLIRLPPMPGAHTSLKSSDEGVMIVGRGE